MLVQVVVEGLHGGGLRRLHGDGLLRLHSDGLLQLRLRQHVIEEARRDVRRRVELQRLLLLLQLLLLLLLSPAVNVLGRHLLLGLEGDRYRSR